MQQDAEWGYCGIMHSVVFVFRSSFKYFFHIEGKGNAIVFKCIIPQSESIRLYSYSGDHLNISFILRAKRMLYSIHNALYHRAKHGDLMVMVLVFVVLCIHNVVYHNAAECITSIRVW